MSSALLVSDQDRLVSDAKETTNRSDDDDSDGSAVFSAEPKVLITDGCSEIWGCTLSTLPNNEECTPEPFSKCYNMLNDVSRPKVFFKCYWQKHFGLSN